MKWWKREKELAAPVVQMRGGSRHPFGMLGDYVPLQNGETRLYRAVREAVPVVDAAIYKLIRMAGGVTVNCGDNQAEEALKEFLRTVPVGRGQFGINAFLDCYSDNDIDLLVRGGVTPLESVSGVISPVRGITTRTTTGGAADATWRELTTILVVDDIIPTVRAALRSKFSRAKNNARSRGAIRSQVIVELEKKVAAEIIDSYGEVAVTADAEDPTVCLVEFSFAVAHGLNQIYLTVHITV